MTDSNAMAANPALVSNSNWPWRIAIVALLTVLADWLFFREYVGISLVLFVLALGIAVVLVNRTGAGLRARIIYAGILVAVLLPCLEDSNVMSVLIAVFGIGCFALGVTGAFKGGMIERLMTIGWLLVSGPLQLLRDLELLRIWVKHWEGVTRLAALKGWIVPLGLGTVFVALFAAANPVMSDWLAHWTTGDTLKRLNPARLAFWALVIIAVWGLVGVSSRLAFPRFDGPANDPPPDIDLSPIFTDAPILRSLVLFNLLFAVQTVMDIHY